MPVGVAGMELWAQSYLTQAFSRSCIPAFDMPYARTSFIQSAPVGRGENLAVLTPAEADETRPRDQSARRPRLLCSSYVYDRKGSEASQDSDSVGGSACQDGIRISRRRDSARRF